MPIRIIKASEPEDKSEVGRDIAMAIPTGLAEGVTGLVGSFGDLRSLGDSAVQKAGELMGFKGPAPKMTAPLPVEIVSRAGAKLMEKATGADPRISRLAMAMTSPAALMSAPTSRELLGAVSDDKPLYQPKTKPGKYARTLAQFAPAAATPGGPVRRAASVVVPGVASEAAGQATEGSAMEPYARIAAAMAGGTAVSMAGRGGPDTRLLAEASRGATDDQVAAARGLMEEAQRRGVQLTMAEALQQVTDAGTGMGRMQRVIEGTRAGNERIAPVMAQRPAQVRQAIIGEADNIAPPAPDPYVLGQQAQDASGQVLTGVRQQINANARPFYQALEQERMPVASPQYQQLIRDPAYQEGLRAVRGNEILNAPIANLPDDSLAVVDEVVKQLDTLAENARPNPAASTGNAQMSAAFEAARRQADELASAVSEPWRLSRSMVASGREAFLEPLQAGPMGAVSKTQNLGAQTSALFPSAPTEGAAPATAQALTMLEQQQPGLGASLTRQQLVNSANEATQDLQSGPNPWGGAKWAATQMGNPEQARTLSAGVGAVGGDPGSLDRLAEVLRATGKRQAPGSLTAYNAKDLEELGKAGVVGEGLRTGLNPPGIFRRLGQGFQDWQTERNAGRLAEAIIAAPADAERILLHARQVVPAGPELQAIERVALAAQLARQPQLEGR
jgi:hypothetical protein